MIIGIEGADGTGKSSLGKKLCCDLECEYYHSKRPVTTEDFKSVLMDLEDMAESKKLYVCDRLPWISEFVYSRAFNRSINYPVKSLVKMLDLNQFVIYCAPSSLNESKVSREIKSHKPASFTDKVIKNHSKIVTLYDDFFENLKDVPYVKYNYDHMDYSDLLKKVKRICVA